MVRTDIVVNSGHRNGLFSFFSCELCGYGVLHLGILLKTLRCEGYELHSGPPKLIPKQGEDTR
jgi:predicted membrane GTPase involved in stress response